jgi:hypothetical protein
MLLLKGDWGKQSRTLDWNIDEVALARARGAIAQ